MTLFPGIKLWKNPCRKLVKAYRGIHCYSHSLMGWDQNTHVHCRIRPHKRKSRLLVILQHNVTELHIVLSQTYT